MRYLARTSLFGAAITASCFSRQAVARRAAHPGFSASLDDLDDTKAFAVEHQGVGEDRPASGRSVEASARKFAPTGFVSSDPPVHDLSHAMRANASMRATALYAG